jgi:hypothetical protein
VWANCASIEHAVGDARALMKTEKAKLVFVKVDRAPSGLILGSSEQVPGLHMAERTMAEFERKTPIILRAIMREEGREVKAVPVESDKPDILAWVLIPEMVDA